ncbi:MAG: gliding motility-associated C-terminal domain-containing protein [Flavobacteriales bacterium]|nr:gliding motility-associated C-terminal domain-containing protein [Flavobacteriales bacterium]
MYYEFNGCDLFCPAGLPSNPDDDGDLYPSMGQNPAGYVPGSPYNLPFSYTNWCAEPGALGIEYVRPPSLVTCAITEIKALECGNTPGAGADLQVQVMLPLCLEAEPLNVVWSSGGTGGGLLNYGTHDELDLAQDTYTVTVTDDDGNVGTCTFDVLPPNPVFATIEIEINPFCAGDANGEGHASANGGTAPYQWNWGSGLSSDSSWKAFSAGTHTVTVTDNNLCTNTAEAVLIDPNPILLSSSPSDESICGNIDGEIDLFWDGGGTYLDITTETTYTNAANDGAVIEGKSATDFPIVISGLNKTAFDVSTLKEVCVNITTVPKDKMEKMSVVLKSPCNGQTLVLKNGTNPGGDEFNVCFTVDATESVRTAAPPFTDGPYLPEGANFDDVANPLIGCNPNGTWNLTLTTTEMNDGVLGSWSMTLEDLTPVSGPPTYAWEGPSGPFSPANDSLLIGLSEGTYTVTATDGNMCTATHEVIVNCPHTRACTVVESLDYNGFSVSCFGASDGQATVTVTGSNPPFSVEWPSANTQAGLLDSETNVEGTLTAGSYEVTMTDNGMVTAVCSVVLDEPVPIVATVGTPVDPSCNGFANGTAIVNFSNGVGLYSVDWNPAGGNPTGLVGPTHQGTGLSGGVLYTAIVTDANGCSISQDITLVDPPAVVLVMSGSDPTCGGDADGTTTVVATGGDGAFTYLWDDPTAQSGATASNLDPDAAGTTYCVTVTDGQGCSEVDCFEIIDPQLVLTTSSSEPSSCGNADGSATVTVVSGGVGTFTYLWDDNILPVPAVYDGPFQTTPTATTLEAGGYNVIVYDGNMCTATAFEDVIDPGSPALSFTNVNDMITCFGYDDGSAEITITGGSDPYIVIWELDGDEISNTEESNGVVMPLTGLGPGILSVAIEADNGCKTSINVTILEPPLLEITNIATTDPTCAGYTDGDATVTAIGGTGAYTYAWNGGGTAALKSNIGDGTHTVTVTDESGCMAIDADVLTEPAGVVSSVVGVNPSCFEQCDGTIDLTITGGTKPYALMWTPGGQIDSNLTAKCAEVYEVLITDGNNCTSTDGVTLTDPALLEITASTAKHASCQNLCFDAEINSVTTGGTSPYDLIWDDDNTSITADVIGVDTGDFIVIVTDSKLCTATDTTHVLGIPILIWDSVVVDIQCYGDAAGSITLSLLARGNGPPYSFNWSGPTNIADSLGTNLLAGDYAVTISDVDGQLNSYAFVVEQPELLTISTTGASILCFGDETAQIHTTATGGVEPYIYLWDDDGATDTDTVFNVGGGTYGITITDDNGCITSSSLDIDPLTPIVASLSLDTVTCYEACDGELHALASGGASGFTFEWFMPNPDSLISPSTFLGICGDNENDSAYWVVISDANQCMVDTMFIEVLRPDSIRAHIRIDGEVLGSTPFEATFIDSSYKDYYNMLTWYIDDNEEIDNKDTVIHEFTTNNTRSFDITLVVSRNGSCMDETTETIVVEAGSFLSIPDVFTPNADDFNDKFMVSYINICELNGRIFNRWGEKLFEWDGVETGWDGRTLSGEEVPDGVYYYLIDAKGCDEKEYLDNKGTVTIIR